MRFALTVLAIALVALVTAAGTAYVAITNELFVNKLTSGPWSARLFQAALDADPYSLAIRTRNSTIPTPIAEAVEFTSNTDSAGKRLVGRCSYQLIGRMPASRIWTIAIELPEGATERNPAIRPANYPDDPYATHSGVVLRQEDGTVRIQIAATVRPGNWLQVRTSGPFSLVTRLYDTPIGEDLRRNPVELPRIEQVSCR